MTNPGEDAGQTASSGSGEGASEPTSTSYEAPPIEQTTEASPGKVTISATQVYRAAARRAAGPPPVEQPGYTPPPAYDPTPYQSPPSYEPAPGYPPGGFPPPVDQSGYPPPPAVQPPPPGFGPGRAPVATAARTPPPPPSRPAPPPGYRPASRFRPAARLSGAGLRPTARTEKTNGMAIGSLVASVVGVCCGIGSIVGIVLGIVAMNQIKQSGEKGHGLAIAGIVVGVLSLLLNVAWTIGAMSS